MDKNMMIKAGFFSGGLLTGSLLGYFLTKKAVLRGVEAEIERQVEEVKNHYRILRKEDVPTTEELRAHKQVYNEKVEELGYDQMSTMSEVNSQDDELAKKIEQLKQANLNNIFDKDTPTPEEIGEEVEFVPTTRNSDEPYVISEEEFYRADAEYEQFQLTYFEVDDVLVDDNETPINDIVSAIGQIPLHDFEKVSGGSNTLHVRNEKREAEYEILRSDSSYTEVVLGIPMDEDDRKKNRPLKMRDHD